MVLFVYLQHIMCCYCIAIDNNDYVRYVIVGRTMHCIYYYLPQPVVELASGRECEGRLEGGGGVDCCGESGRQSTRITG